MSNNQRIIKFRVFDTNLKKFTDGYENSNNYDELYSDPPGLLFSALKNLEKSEEYIIQQFTGLYDKNEKEIYEGDIVKDLDNEYGQIKYENGSFIVEMKNKAVIPFYSMLVYNGLAQQRIVNPKTYSVVGNIFENSELLK